ncbi:ORF124 [Lymantria xylina nucleopolyhedrovirus]|uniref:ORF124 n=1 Tax=Lymantria xylina multiple nucleopolyhedrovirus TaxID=2847840 RepID=D4N2G1_9ABAC|nr:ORF124 [Lymantria xylina nucleopolyhedrovirus]ADD73833.1 ORF124 [Lymantria xylina nucleopolyhedrovirus]
MECYICFEIVSALRTVAPGCGHAVCCKCYSKLASCPVCRRRFSPRRPALESTTRPSARPELCLRDDFKRFVFDMCLSFFD